MSQVGAGGDPAEGCTKLPLDIRPVEHLDRQDPIVSIQIEDDHPRLRLELEVLLAPPLARVEGGTEVVTATAPAE